MRYTRYDYKKKKGDNFIIWILGIVVFSICVGMIFYKLFLQKSNVSDTMKNRDTVNNSVSVDDSKIDFGIIQCGVFKDKANAEATLNSINSDPTGFIVEDDGSFKLIYGIYKFEDAGKKSDDLNAASVSNFRIKCSVKAENEEERAESEILDAYIKVVNKVTEKDVKGVDTKEFKAWTNNIAGEIKNPNEELSSLLKSINELPDEYRRENQRDSLKQVYNILKKYKQK